jgi:hypothetical protein
MTGFSAWARGHDQHLLKTPKTKVTEQANKKQILYFALYSPPLITGSMPISESLLITNSVRPRAREDFMISF